MRLIRGLGLIFLEAMGVQGGRRVDGIGCRGGGKGYTLEDG
jgi:hypothetical protein